MGKFKRTKPPAELADERYRRKDLKALKNQFQGRRLRFMGTIAGHRIRGRLILLKPLRDFRGEEIADHVWIKVTSREWLRLTDGQEVSFDAIVERYESEERWGLRGATNIQVLYGGPGS